MPAKILSGQALSQAILLNLKKRIASQSRIGKEGPGLAVILVGEDPASKLYVERKRKACENIGIRSKAYDVNAKTTESSLISLIDQLNSDQQIHGILIQLPLPGHIDTLKIINRVSPLKDVDGFHAVSMGNLLQQEANLRPCTPKGIMTLIESTKTKLIGLNAVVVGASLVVGRPMMLELLNAGCTVTICHQNTINLQEFVKQADIIVVAVGKAHIIKGKWIKSGALVIDVGMNRLSNGKLCGDVEFEQACLKAAWITPVPGGVGPMTVATLMQNTVQAWENE